MFITEEDKQKLRFLAENGIATYRHSYDAQPREQDHVGSPFQNGATLSPENSARLVLAAVDSTNSQAAENFGVSERTVERHKAFWADGDDQEAVGLEKTNHVDDRLCGAMRCAASEGASLGELAKCHGLAKSTVQHHVSVNSSQECSHFPEVAVPRVSFKHGGMRGNSNRSRNERGQFADD